MRREFSHRGSSSLYRSLSGCLTAHPSSVSAARKGQSRASLVSATRGECVRGTAAVGCCNNGRNRIRVAGVYPAPFRSDHPRNTRNDFGDAQSSCAPLRLAPPQTCPASSSIPFNGGRTIFPRHASVAGHGKASLLNNGVLYH